MSMKLFVVSLVLALALFNSVGAIRNDISEENDLPTEFALFEDDDVETAAMIGPKILFKDFCIRTRDSVQAHVKELTRSGTRSVFNILLDAEDSYQIDDRALDKAHVAQADIAESVKVVEDSLSGSSDDDKSMVQKAEGLKQNPIWKTVKGAVSLVLQAALNFAYTEAATRFNKLKARFTTADIKSFVDEACYQATLGIRKELDKDFLKSRSEAMDAAEKSGAFTEEQIMELALQTFETVGCVTTRRLTTITKYCSFLAVAGPVIWPLLDN